MNVHRRPLITLASSSFQYFRSLHGIPRFMASASVTPKRQRKKKASDESRIDIIPKVVAEENLTLFLRSSPITIVDSSEKARAVAKLLLDLQEVVSWNIEATDIDTRRFHTAGTGGRVLCASAYVPNKLCVFIDAQPLSEDEDGTTDGYDSPILNELKTYFESDCHLKSSHSVADDIHVLSQHGIQLRGVESDTRYLARLANTAFSSWEGSAFKHTDPYALVDDDTTTATGTTAKGYDLRSSIQNFNPSLTLECSDKKIERFLKRFNGPKIAHYSATMRNYWIQQTVESAALTHDLRDQLKSILEQTEWTSEVFSSTLSCQTMWDLARSIHIPLVCLLASVEQTGIGIDEPFLESVRKKTQELVNLHREKFIDSASNIRDPFTGKLLNPNANLINPNSVHHVRQLLFGYPSERTSDWFQYGKKADKTRIPNRAIFQTDGGSTTVTVSGIGLRPIQSKLNKKRLSDYSAKGLPSVNQKLLIEYAGVDPENGKLGRAADPDQLPSFASDQYTHQSCVMMHHLLNMGKYDYVIGSFIDPLMEKIVNHNRIHPSLSLDTSTGRLVCRKPNLHNPPNASDTLGLRAAFVASPGKSLIVADYSQLELRILAHVTNCKSMIDSLNAGGDYHSWTAYDMFAEVREAVDSNKCQIASTRQDLPLVKSMFGPQRSKAKAINFSIAYGKCARSIAEDLDIELVEAEGLLTRWYQSKPEVAQWKMDTVFSARVTKKVKSILGRTRDIPHINKAAWKGRSERAAVNHCIQGSAADIAICAMLRIGSSEELADLGYKLLMQIHDEFIIEGPSENAEKAETILSQIMRNPFHDINPGYQFKVELEVDAGIGHSWLEAKP